MIVQEQGPLDICEREAAGECGRLPKGKDQSLKWQPTASQREQGFPQATRCAHSTAGMASTGPISTYVVPYLNDSTTTLLKRQE